MAHKLLWEQAIQLRIQGNTFGQIKKQLGVPKATLSGWLSKLPLTETQLELLSKNKQLSKDYSREKYIETRKRQRLNRLHKILEVQSKELLPLSDRELFIAGLFLYWGEGEKRHGKVSISNTDPRIVKFSLFWMTHLLKIPKEKVRILLHLYKDMNINESINYWSIFLDIPITQFKSPYIKKSNREGLTYKGFGHGTCKLYICDVNLSEKIAMSLKSISDFYGTKDNVFWYN